MHTREFPFGKATVFYSEASEESCTAAVLRDVDPVGIARGRGGKCGAEDQYINDRPYVASSLLSVVLSRWSDTELWQTLHAPQDPEPASRRRRARQERACFTAWMSATRMLRSQL